jgi:hypothetical protein
LQVEACYGDAWEGHHEVVTLNYKCIILTGMGGTSSPATESYIILALVKLFIHRDIITSHMMGTRLWQHNPFFPQRMNIIKYVGKDLLLAQSVFLYPVRFRISFLHH